MAMKKDSRTREPLLFLERVKGIEPSPLTLGNVGREFQEWSVKIKSLILRGFAGWEVLTKTRYFGTFSGALLYFCCTKTARYPQPRAAWRVSLRYGRTAPAPRWLRTAQVGSVRKLPFFLYPKWDTIGA